jgi:hypothetical protein
LLFRCCNIETLRGEKAAMTLEQPSGQRLLSTLRQFVRPRPKTERCELCSTDLCAEHQHLIEPANRRLVCCCDACAILFSGHQNGRYRRVPRVVQYFPDFRLTDTQWEGLHLPINLAFFYRSTAAGGIVALYPSPAGATESLLALETWQDLAVDNPFLQEMEPDVEALLVNRMGATRDYCRVPIDECYKLVGLIRTHWRGLSGGVAVWKEIEGFFASLKHKSVHERGAAHA